MNLKKERGSVTVIVLVTILFFVIVLSAAFSINASLRKSQLKSQLSLKGTYESDLDNADKYNPEVIYEYTDIYEETEKYIDKNGDTVYIPKGYARCITDGGNSVSEGLIITDKIDSEHHSIGNEWIWIPTLNMYDNDTEYGIDGATAKAGILYSYTGTAPEKKSIETYTTYSEHVAYNDMVISLQKYQGYYVSRYNKAIYDTPNDSVIAKKIYASQLNNMINWLISLGEFSITYINGTDTRENREYCNIDLSKDEINYRNMMYIYAGKNEKSINIKDLRESGETMVSNTIAVDEYQNYITIPAGFKVSSDSGTSSQAGIVIEDVNAGDNYTVGNQFVWIPIGQVNTNSYSDAKTIELSRYSFSRAPLLGVNAYDDGKVIEKNYTQREYLEPTDGVDVSYGETLLGTLYDRIYTKEAENSEFSSSAENAKGYYIGRYEARKGENNNATQISTQYVYDLYSKTDPQQVAIELCENMYNNSNFKTTLVNSYAWDTAIKAIDTLVYGKSKYHTTAGYSSTTEHSSPNYLGKKESAMKIYDMGGNFAEITTEIRIKSSISTEVTGYIVRGGCGWNTNDFLIDNVAYTLTYKYENYRAGARVPYQSMGIGGFAAFRPILYIAY